MLLFYECLQIKKEKGEETGCKHTEIKKKGGLFWGVGGHRNQMSSFIMRVLNRVGGGSGEMGEEKGKRREKGARREREKGERREEGKGKRRERGQEG